MKATNCFIKLYERAVTLVFPLFFKCIETCKTKIKYFSDINTNCVEQNNKHVTDSIKI